MKILQLLSAVIFCCLLWSSNLKSEIIYVSSQQEFDNAHDNAMPNDSIVWRSGTYSDIFMDIDKDNLFIMAETLGSTVFTGASRVDITSDYITLEGFQFLNGDIGTRDVINTRGSYNVFTQINIRAYRSYKYLRVREESEYVEITYCNFENRLNLDDQNILSILVDDVNPGYHKIQYCSFKNFDGTGNDLGIEPIRIGLSRQAENISRCLVEYCYFTQCNGDGELISSKATQNVYRFNTFENNPLAELVLRHGSEAIVYGNFFLNGKGGVRVREGQDHYIYNNYFYELDDRAIYLQNENSDPLDNINIAFNTIFDCAEVILGNDGNNKPTNVTFANNIFSNPDDDLFEESTGSETWIGNMAFGDLGIQLPATGIRIVDPELESNSEGFFGLSSTSPAINAAQSSYTLLPQFEGIEEIDSEILFDLMGQNRPLMTEEKDLGCSEYPQDILISPIATEENTGPSYNTSILMSLQNTSEINIPQIEISPNPVSELLNITIDSQHKDYFKLEIYNLEGQRLDSISERTILPGKTIISEDIKHLPNGVYMLHVLNQNIRKEGKGNQVVKFVKSK